MRAVLLCLSAISVLWATNTIEPKAPVAGLLPSVPVISDLNQEQELPGHLTTPDGSLILLRRYASPGSNGVQLRLSNFHLPPDATALVYGIAPGGQTTALKTYTASGPTQTGEFLTHVVPGAEVIVEIVWGQEVTAGVPFEVAEIRNAAVEAQDSVDEPGPVQGVLSTTYRGRELTYEVRDGLAIFENDIVLGPADEVARGDGEPDSKDAARFGMGITGLRYRWPGGKIPYVINSALPYRDRVTAAISHWNTKLSGVIRIVPRTNEITYVEFVRAGGCSSSIGMLYGRQLINISDSCTTGSVIHEIGHAVGLWHEQSRQDRNSYVKILWSNISSTATHNFNQANLIADDLNSYDFSSIMHYHDRAFSTNGYPTIQTIPAGIPIGQREGLSSGDIAAVRRMYGATTSSTTTTVTAPTTTYSSPVEVTVSSNPAGQQYKVDGVVYSYARTFTWTLGSSHVVEAVNTANASWVKWSNGGTRSQTVTASSSLTALTATYSVAYKVSTASTPSSGGTLLTSPENSSDLYPAGTVLRLAALPNPGYCFAGWSGLLAGTPASTSLTVNRDYWIAANFVPGSVTLSRSSVTASAQGGSYSFGVTANSSCTWTVQEGASWLSITSGTRQTGSSVVTFTVSPNTSNVGRWAVITAGGRALAVYQMGVD